MSYFKEQFASLILFQFDNNIMNKNSDYEKNGSLIFIAIISVLYIVSDLSNSCIQSSIFSKITYQNIPVRN